MDTYKVIESIQINHIYDLDNHSPSLEEMNNLVDFMRRDDHTESMILTFLKTNPSCTLHIIKLIPVPKIVSLYQNNNFMANYISNALIETIIDKNIFRIRQKIINGNNYENEFMKLTNCLNDKYNFTTKYVITQFNKLVELFSFVNTDDYYIGYNVGNQIALYARKRVIRINDCYCNENIIWIANGGITIVVYRRKYDNLADVLLNHDDIVFDGCDSWCMFSRYQTLDTKSGTVNKIDIEGAKSGGYGKFFLKNIKYSLNIGHQRCYICRRIYDMDIVYERYHSMCLSCGQNNWEKRTLTADLTGCTAFVTGIRHKIGLQVALKLLRCGSKVIGTTRFPYFAKCNYIKQIDYDTWKNNLVICGCDFLKIDQVNNLISFLQQERINILINNAAQTVRPSKQYLDRLIEFENKTKLAITHKVESEFAIMQTPMNNLVLNQFNDIDDNRDQTSWTKTLDEIDANEIFETIIINQTVPTLFVSQLKKQMRTPKFIINVTAKEGKFDTDKTGHHAHTNMCKAAINMMIRTLSEEADPDQYVYSIDPGFVSGVNPQINKFPLSDEDGAARIVNPILEYYNGNSLPKNYINLKNYRHDTW